MNKIYDSGIDKSSKVGEKEFEEGKERRVIEGPFAGLVEVPLMGRKRIGEGKPMAVHFEICAVVGREQKELEACSHGCHPDKQGWPLFGTAAL